MKTHICSGWSPGEPVVVEELPARCSKHTPLPAGYTARQDFAEHMSKTHTQIACQGCGRWAIWLPHAEALAELARRLAEMQAKSDAITGRTT